MRTTMRLLMCLSLMACGDVDDDKKPGATDDFNQSGDDTGVESDDTGTTGDDTGSPPDKPTYYNAIAPLVETHCARCHYDGGLGTGDFTEKDNVIAMGEVMLGQIEAGLMPPPVADPDCRPYDGYAHLTLDADEKAQFSEWVSLGKPEGEPSSLVEVDPIETELDDVDMELYMAAPYTPVYLDDANPGNEYRCFVIDPGQEETFYVTALAPILDQKDIIHHIVLFKKPYTEIAEHELADEGYDCIDAGMADGVTGLIAGWAPGGLPVIYEEGQGMPITPTDRLVLQVHYFQSGPDAVGLADQTGYAFRTAPAVDTSVLMVPFGTTSFRIPAGDAAYSDRFSFPLPYSFDILGVFPHMHVLGTGYHMTLANSEGTQCLVESEEYDFDNQQMFMFEEPIHVEYGDILSMECTWDNSADNPDQMNDPPQDIFYGERTDEEMCFAFTLAAY